MSSATVNALTAYQVGEVIGRGAFLVLGVALVVLGLRRRRASSRPVPAPPPAGVAPQVAAPGGAPVPYGSAPFAAPAGSPVPYGSAPVTAPTRRRGTGLVVAGSALVLLSLASAATQAAGRVERKVALPDSVLELPQNATLSAQASAALLQDRSDELENAQVAAYGSPPQAVLVLATPHGDSSPDRALRGLKAGFERSSGAALGDGTRVDPGRLGGGARCWSTSLQDVPAAVCAFVDGGSVVTVYDFVETGAAAAAGRARTVREAAVR